MEKDTAHYTIKTIRTNSKGVYDSITYILTLQEAHDCLKSRVAILEEVLEAAEEADQSWHDDYPQQIIDKDMMKLRHTIAKTKEQDASN